jgi:hypothetical protein
MFISTSSSTICHALSPMISEAKGLNLIDMLIKISKSHAMHIYMGSIPKLFQFFVEGRSSGESMSSTV